VGGSGSYIGGELHGVCVRSQMGEERKLEGNEVVGALEEEEKG
jgi:hypothetical protein